MGISIVNVPLQYYIDKYFHVSILFCMACIDSIMLIRNFLKYFPEHAQIFYNVNLQDRHFVVMNIGNTPETISGILR